MTTERVVHAATCLGCGCTCDDIVAVVRDDMIVEARNACTLGLRWFGDGRAPSRARVAGREVRVDEALTAAVEVLTRAARPLVYLAPDISCETQREAVALADATRAILDSVTSTTAMDGVLAAQERGRAGATLGEIRNRADVLVFWGVDPADRYPRYWTRYAPEPAGLFVPQGRRSRRVVAVDVDDAHGPADADLRIVVPAEDEVAWLTVLTALVATDRNRVSRNTAHAVGLTSNRRADAHGSESVPSSSPVSRVDALADVLASARYAVVVADGEAASGAGRDPGRASALIALAQALNASSRGALSLLRAGGNRSGAESVMTWQTGFPAAVDFARAYPRYRPYDGSAWAAVAGGGIDAALVVGSVDLCPSDLVSKFAGLPRVLIGPRATESAVAGADVVVDTAIAGIHEAGTAVRMDDVPVPLRAIVGGLPAAAAVVGELRRRIAATPA